MGRQSPRRICLEALRRWDETKGFAQDILNDCFRQSSLSAADKHFVQNVCFGILRNRRLLDAWLAVLRDGSLDSEARRILQVGLYQLGFMRVPEHAAVNETVVLAPRRMRGLVNAILRRAARERGRLAALVTELPPAVRYSLPDFLFAKWERQFGSEEAERLAQWNQEPAPNYVRLNRLAPEAGAFLADPTLVTSWDESDRFFQCKTIPDEWIASGLVYFQDPATAIACELLDPQPGETVLDACAAPGGKTAYLAERMENRGRLLACDVVGWRLERLKENLRRMHVRCAQVIAHDWLRPEAELFALPEVDRLLLDVPCSNTGVLRRRVDLRWRLQPGIFDEMALLQERISLVALCRLRAGGRAVYSTCSIEPEENGYVVERLLQACPGMALVDVRETKPWRDDCDGIYAALLEKLTEPTHPFWRAALLRCRD